ncbi:MAG: site-specific integrase [Pseudomonadota bacterium]
MGVTIREKPKGSGIYWLFINHQGKRKAKRVGDKKAAQALARQVEQRLAAKDLGILKEEKTVPLFKDYSELWLEKYTKIACKDNTYRLYKMLLARHLSPVFSNKRIDEIFRPVIKELFVEKLTSGLAISTVLNMKACLSGIFSNAIEDSLLLMNPVSGTGKLIKKFKQRTPKEEIKPLTKQEVSLLLKAVNEHYPRYYPLFLCSLRTGARIGEVTALQWGDVDFNGRFLEINRAISLGKVSTPKSGKSRRVDMSLQLAETLKELKTERKRETLKKGWSCMPEWIFVSESGTPYDPNNLRKVFNDSLDKAGLRRIRIHDMRHTFASILLAQGEPLPYVRDQLGHHSIQITVDTYGHMIPGANRSAVDKLDDFEATIRNPGATNPEPETKKAPSLSLSA